MSSQKSPKNPSSGGAGNTQAKASSWSQNVLAPSRAGKRHVGGLRGGPPELGLLLPLVAAPSPHHTHTHKAAAAQSETEDEVSGTGLQGEGSFPQWWWPGLARAAQWLLWVDSRDHQKVYLLWCSTSSSVPFLERARGRSHVLKARCHAVATTFLHARFKCNRKSSACKGHSEGWSVSQRRENVKILEWVPFPIA